MISEVKIHIWNNWTFEKKENIFLLAILFKVYVLWNKNDILIPGE